MTTPLVPLENNLDPRSFAFYNCSTERLNQGLNVGERDRCRCRPREDCVKRFPVLGVHQQMLSLNDSICKTDGATAARIADG